MGTVSKSRCRGFLSLASVLPALLAIPAAAWKSEDLGGMQIFPADNHWHWDISGLPVHPNSAAFIASVGAAVSLHPDFGSELDGIPWGIPYTVVGKDAAKVPIVYTAFGDESDPGPYPAPLDSPIEGGPQSDGDRHVLTLDKDAKLLYELYRAFPKAAAWEAESGARWNLASNALRQPGWTSADAAGLPILPGLVRYDELARGEIDHAIRMTVRVSQRKYIWPATHHAGSTTSADAPPMGLRFRLKAGYDITRFPPAAQVILRAMKKHGLIVADNGGNWYFTGAPDERHPDEDIDLLKQLRGSDFEAVLSVDESGNPIRPPSAVRPMLIPRRAGAAGPWHDFLGRAVGARRHPAMLPLARTGADPRGNPR